MEPVEDAERQRRPDDDGPRHEPVEAQLHGTGLGLLHLERVDDPQREVAHHEEGDHLPPRLRLVVLRQVGGAAGDLRHEQRLQRHLDDGQTAGHHHQEVGDVVFRGQRPGDDAEHGVDVQPVRRDGQQDVPEMVGSVGLEPQPLDAEEAEHDGEDGHDHDGRVRDVGQEYRQKTVMLVLDQNKEHYEAYGGDDQYQQSEEQAFAGSGAVHLGQCLDAGGARQAVFSALCLAVEDGVFSDVLPHDVEDCRPDQTVLDDEGEQEGGRVRHDGPHDVLLLARVAVVFDVVFCKGKKKYTLLESLMH